MTLSASLKRLVWMLVSGVALSMVLFAALPEMAEAQQVYGDPTQADQNTKGNVEGTAERLVVVEPGDSLWSITQERLGQDASPEQILNEVGRTFELNRDLLGENPDLILPGQELSLPSVAGPSTTTMPQVTPALPEPAAKPTPQPIAEPSLTAAAPEEEPAAEPVAGESSVTKAPEEQPAEEQPAEEESAVEKEGGGIEQQSDEPSSLLPETSPTEEDVSAASVEEPLRNKPQVTSRRQLGLGILVLTFLVAIFMAWKLPMKRNLRDFEAAQRVHLGQANDHLSYRGFDGSEETQRTAPLERPDPDHPLHGSGVGPLTKQNDIDRSEMIVAAVGGKRKKVLRMRAPAKRRLLRKRHAANAYNPHIRSSLKRAPGTVARNNRRNAALRASLWAHRRL